MSQFMLLVRYDEMDLPSFSPEDYQKMIVKFQEWRKKLQDKGVFINSGKLKDGDSMTLRQKNGRTVFDGPYCETKEALAGYFLIEAKNVEHAAEFANLCPILPFGGSVEIRELEMVDEPA